MDINEPVNTGSASIKPVVVNQAKKARNRHYMSLAVEALDLQRLKGLCDSMLERKHVHKYTDVARIWVLTVCREYGPKHAIKKAAELGISKETRRHFFCGGKGHCSCSGEGLEHWLARMKGLHLRKASAACVSEVPSAFELSEGDLKWMESLFLAKPIKERVYRRFAAEVRNIAEVIPGRQHLKGISHVTVWRYCKHLKNAVATPGVAVPVRVPQKRKRPYESAVARALPPTEAFKELVVEARPDSNCPF